MSQNTKKPKNIRKRILIIVLAVILGLYILPSFVVSPIIYKVLFGRYEQPVYTLELTYSDYPGAPERTDHSYLSGKNTLHGVYYPAAEDHGLIILVNGQHAGIDTHFTEIDYFVEAGWNVFTYDATGVRTSEGKSQKGLSQAYIDLRNTIDYLETSGLLHETTVLYGHSLGGLAAGSVLTETEEGQIDAAVLVAPLASPVKTMFSYAKNYVGPMAYAEYPFLMLQDFFVFGKDSNVSALKGVNTHEIPILLVEGTNDETLHKTHDGLFEEADRITNPKLSVLVVDEEYRNEHSTMWLTQDAAKLKLEKEAELSELVKQYDGEIPTDVYIEFQKPFSLSDMYELDEDYMLTVLTLYESARQ